MDELLVYAGLNGQLDVVEDLVVYNLLNFREQIYAYT